MRTSLIAIVLAASLLAACSKSSAPSSAAAAKPGDAVTQNLQQLAGSGATDCGRIESQDPSKLKPAGDCALSSAKDKKAFYVAYDMPGLTVGIAGNSQGKLSWVQSETPPNAPAGTKGEVKSAPCPAELRVAQSGRVTCMTPAAMGAMSGENPHGMMPPAGGTNPHGGMGTTPGVANPHENATPSHPTTKTPPKQ